MFSGILLGWLAGLTPSQAGSGWLSRAPEREIHTVEDTESVGPGAAEIGAQGLIRDGKKYRGKFSILRSVV